MNDSYTVVIIENETGVVHIVSEWECIPVMDDEMESTKALYKIAAAAIASIIARIGATYITVSVKIHTA